MTHPVEDPESVLVERLKQTLRAGGKLLRLLPESLSPHVPTDVSMAAFEEWVSTNRRQLNNYPLPDSKIAKGLALLIQMAVDRLVRDGVCKVTGRGERLMVQLLEEPPAAHADSSVVPESRHDVTAPATDRASQIKDDLLADGVRPSHDERCQQRIQSQRSRHDGRPVETHEAADLSPLDEESLPADLNPTGPLEGVDLQRFRDYLPPHRPDEARKLTEAIAADGCRTPLLVGVIGGKKYLVDGFNRQRICEALGLHFAVAERGFASDDEALAWMRANFGAGRNGTRTANNYYLGCDYLSEKHPRGGDRGNQHTGGKGKKVPFDSTAEAIARKHRCSDKHVKDCARFARHLEEAVGCGLDFLKWPILHERIKYTRKLLDDLILAGPGGCQAAVESLLAEDPDRQITAGMIRKAVGVGDEAPAEEERPQRDPAELISETFITDSEDVAEVSEPAPRPPTPAPFTAKGEPQRSAVEVISETFEKAVALATSIDDLKELRRIVRSVESHLAALRAILSNKRWKNSKRRKK
jgi:hypothetical protein